MNVDNIPINVKQIMQDKELSIHKKMVAFMAFMPKLPSDPKNDQAWKDNEKIGGPKTNPETFPIVKIS